jgi:HD-like signal output (HDOD) protein
MGQDYVTTRPQSVAGASQRELDSSLATDTVVIPVKLCNLPPMSEIANQVLALSADADVDLKKLSQVMERDPAFAADVLFLANSSLFGFPQRMQVLRHAVAVLGLDRIRALAVTVAMRGFLGTGSSLVRQCWQHSAACALVCEEIAPIFRITSDVAYTLGLMHDIGRLGFVKCYASESNAVMSRTYDTVDQVLDAERALLNVDHGRAGAWLVKNWAFPATFAECCEHHHDPFNAQDPELLKMVKAGCRIADALGFSAVKYTGSFSYDDVIWSLPPDIHRESFPSATELKESIDAKLAIFR